MPTRMPMIQSPPGAVRPKEMTHLAFVWAPDQRGELFVDGKRVAKSGKGGSLSNWNVGYRLAIGDEVDGGRFWKGFVRRAVVYASRRSADQIANDFAAGPNAELRVESPEMRSDRIAGEKREKARNRRSAFFQQKVAPILVRNCIECHDAASGSGGLVLSTRDAALRGGDSGKAIVAGDLDASLLWQSVVDDSMPHDRSPLRDSEKDILRDWIADEGAIWSVALIDPASYRHGVAPKQRWVRRLTKDEYVETIRGLLRVDVSDLAKRVWPSETRADGFANTAYNLTVDLKLVDAMRQLAEFATDRVDAASLAKQFSKNRTLTDDNMRPLIEKMGQLVLRGQLSKREIALYRGISTTVAASGGEFDDAIRFVLETMLQSPRFVYRYEDHSRRTLSDREIANRIAYMT
ncbi:MAG: c-type cytochrome domain-containing protein, partial [Planctomycetota bacterium]